MRIEKILNATCKSGSFLGECNFPQNKRIFEKIANSTNNNTVILDIITFPKENLNSCFSNQMPLKFEVEFQSANMCYALTFVCNAIFHDDNINENYSTVKNEICYTSVELIFGRTSKITVTAIS